MCIKNEKKLELKKKFMCVVSALDGEKRKFGMVQNSWVSAERKEKWNESLHTFLVSVEICFWECCVFYKFIINFVFFAVWSIIMGPFWQNWINQLKPFLKRFYFGFCLFRDICEANKFFKMIQMTIWPRFEV